MDIRAAEISAILKEQIKNFGQEAEVSEVGQVLSVGDGIARVYGLENAGSLEMLEFEHGVTGLAFNLEEDDVGVALFGEWEHVSEGEPVRRRAARRAIWDWRSWSAEPCRLESCSGSTERS